MHLRRAGLPLKIVTDSICHYVLDLPQYVASALLIEAAELLPDASDHVVYQLCHNTVYLGLPVLWCCSFYYRWNLALHHNLLNCLPEARPLDLHSLHFIPCLLLYCPINKPAIFLLMLGPWEIPYFFRASSCRCVASLLRRPIPRPNFSADLRLSYGLMYFQLLPILSLMMSKSYYFRICLTAYFRTDLLIFTLFMPRRRDTGPWPSSCTSRTSAPSTSTYPANRYGP